MKTIEKERYSESELDDLARDVYDQEVDVLGMKMDALRIIKELDEPYYSQLTEGLQEYITYYICPVCGDEHEDENDAEDCHADETDTESE